jgi:hypothetical protein
MSEMMIGDDADDEGNHAQLGNIEPPVFTEILSATGSSSRSKTTLDACIRWPAK